MNAFEEVGCVSCHSGAAFNGPAMPSGKGFFVKFPTFEGSRSIDKFDLLADEGRFEATGNEADKHVWRVPTLRNLMYTAPYFHNGAIKSLDEAVVVMAETQLNKQVAAEQVADIVSFLESLTGEFPVQTMPRLPPTPGDLLD